jgi:L-fuculose-phosphate aldolase
VATNDGNISVRLDQNTVLITLTGVGKGLMQADDLIILDYDAFLLANHGSLTIGNNLLNAYHKMENS